MSRTTQLLFALHEASGADLHCIENMMHFYNYELSESYPIEFDANGFFRISSKAAYWSGPHVFPFLIRVNDNLAGFVVVDDDLLDRRFTYNLGYFFVAKRYQGQGLGGSVLSALLQRFPGSWEIYHLAKNANAARFWSNALHKAGVGELTVSNEVIHDEPSILYRFVTGNGI